MKMQTYHCFDLNEEYISSSFYQKQDGLSRNCGSNESQNIYMKIGYARNELIDPMLLQNDQQK